MTPTKVTVEITTEGYTTTVYARDEIVVQRAMVMRCDGHARGTKKGTFYDDLTGPLEGLAEAIESHDPFETCQQLRNLRFDDE